jgi:hypothetical protein
MFRMTGGSRRALRGSVICVAAVAVLATSGVAVATGRDSDATAFTPRASPLQRGPIGASADDIVTARAVDRRRGLVYTIESSNVFGSSLYVTFVAQTPASVRAALLRRPLIGTCDVPGRDVREFPGRWNRRYHGYGTALLTDSPVLVARVATTCALYVGREGGTAATAVFPRHPFSQVRMR